MSSGPKTTKWEALPHTLAKIAILKAYMRAYVPILGSSKRHAKIIIHDGFAGPDQYTNGKSGSPTAVLTAGKDAISQLGPRWVAGDLTCVFSEPDMERYRSLDNQVDSMAKPGRLKAVTLNKSFVEATAWIEAEYSAALKIGAPRFTFIDPFGATGAPFTVIKKLLGGASSEILMNFDADGVSRIFAAASDNKKNEANLDVIFPHVDWRSELGASDDHDDRSRRALKLFKAQLTSVPGVRYVFETEMRDQSDNLSYYLVFAGKHPLGLMRMKEAMKSIDQDGSFRFSDAHVGSQTLFRFDDPQKYAEAMHQHFKGQTVKFDDEFDDITLYALTQTPFINAKSLLVILEDEGSIRVTALPGRKKRAFNKQVTSIEFIERIRIGSLF